MPWFVLPLGLMLVTSVVIVVQLLVSASTDWGHESYCSAENLLELLLPGAVTLVSELFELGPVDRPRSTTQPFHVLWFAGVQFLPAPWQSDLLLYHQLLQVPCLLSQS